MEEPKPTLDASAGERRGGGSGRARERSRPSVHLLAASERGDGAHVVQPVRELDEQRADVGHGGEHVEDGGRLEGVRVVAVQLRHLAQARHLLDLPAARCGVEGCEG